MNKIDKINNFILKELVHTFGDADNFVWSNDLDKVGKYYFGGNWRGVKPNTQSLFPRGLKRGDAFILNTSPVEEDGKHWVGVYCYANSRSKSSKGVRVIIYNSFGNKHYHKELTEMADKIKGMGWSYVFTDDDSEQNVKEDNCGFRCIAFLLICTIFGINNAKKL